jgi:hypothetical protein
MMENLLVARLETEKIAEPVKKVMHVAEADIHTICWRGLGIGIEVLGNRASHSIPETAELVEDLLNPQRSVEVSIPMSNEVAETIYLKAQLASRAITMLCGCGGKTKFKLVDVD